jgi:hypothetical protein
MPFVDEFVPDLGDHGLSGAEYADLWEGGWRITRRLILEMDALARANGAKFAVMVVPERLQVEPDFRARIEAENSGIRLDPARINVLLAGFCSSAGIPLFDPTPTFARAYCEEGSLLYNRIVDRHWNAAGHELAATELARFLDLRKLVPSEP